MDGIGKAIEVHLGQELHPHARKQMEKKKKKSHVKLKKGNSNIYIYRVIFFWE